MKTIGTNMKTLNFPTHRIVFEATDDEHLGKMSTELWKKVESDIVGALEENSEAYDDCERKIYG